LKYQVLLFSRTMLNTTPPTTLLSPHAFLDSPHAFSTGGVA